MNRFFVAKFRAQIKWIWIQVKRMQRLRKLICKFVVFEDLNSGNSNLKLSEKFEEGFNSEQMIPES